MTKPLLVTLVFAACATAAIALTVPAEVEGVEVWVKEYQLKKQYSEPMASAQVEAKLDLTEGIASPLSTALTFEEVDQNAAELSITFDNAYVHVKAHAFDETSGIYYYTSETGVQQTTADPESQSDYDFLDIGEIFPGDDDGRYVAQSYFPVPVLIEGGSSHVIHGLVNLEYAVFFWDGVGTPTGNASWTGAVFTGTSPAFALAELDAVLALDKEITSEVYLFAESSAALDSDDFNQYKAFALYFDSDGNLHDGASKNGTGYDVPSGPSRVGAWKRIKGTTPLSDGTIPFSIARTFDTSASDYYYEYTTAGFERVADAGIDVEQTFSATVDGSTVTVYYKRVK